MIDNVHEQVLCFVPLFLYISFYSQRFVQHAQWRSSRDHLIFKSYNIFNHPLSSADIGRFTLAIVELRCLDVGQRPSKFSRVTLSFLYIYI